MASIATTAKSLNEGDLAILHHLHTVLFLKTTYALLNFYIESDQRRKNVRKYLLAMN